MSIVFFLSIFTAFLYFCVYYILSPKRNPKYATLMAHENAPTEASLQMTAHVLNILAMVLTIGLIATVPFLRAVAAIGMAGLVVRFFYRRFFGTGEPAGQQLRVNMHDDPRNTPSASKESPGHHGYHTEEDGRAFDPKRGNGGGTSH